MNIDQAGWQLFEKLWKHYTDRVVDARAIESALKKRGDVWNEDHVAFRTLPGKHTGLHVLEAVFEAFGYKRKDNYKFEDKQLNAYWYEPKETNQKCEKVLPKIFISELVPNKFSPAFQKIVREASEQVTADPTAELKRLAAQGSFEQLVDLAFAFLTEGPSWRRPFFAEYETLRKESEYAAWTLLFGSRINHFTVSVQLMRSVSSLKELNDLISGELRIPLNSSGGLIKGTSELRLEQSSTLACELPVLFQDTVKKLPYAFVEFAYRYPLERQKNDGHWHSYYQGFVTSNADKIFESTDVRH